MAGAALDVRLLAPRLGVRMTELPDLTPPTLTAAHGPAVVTLGVQASGHFHLAYNGGTSAAINYDATAATVQTALCAVTQVGTGNATVTGVAGGPFTVTFVGARAAGTTPLEFDGSALGTPANASVANVLQLTAVDLRSGVRKICYTVDGGPTMTMWADPAHRSFYVTLLKPRLKIALSPARIRERP